MISLFSIVFIVAYIILAVFFILLIFSEKSKKWLRRYYQNWYGYASKEDTEELKKQIEELRKEVKEKKEG